ncbi:MAG: 50S ribosomal protein L31e [Nanoarchaeota archaeon]|nr:50S ribosomal protein L31e [Nanoarchaeota archaeon]
MERTYTIPLRSECLKVPIFLRARKCIKAIRNFTIRHMKVEDVKIGKYLNLKIWERGSRHPPSKVQVVIEIISEKKGAKELKFARVELVGAPKEVKKVEEKKGLAAKLKDKITGKDEKAEAKAAEIKEEEKLMEKAEEEKMERAKAPLPKEHYLDKKSDAKTIREKQFMRDHREQRPSKPQAQIVR